jgi:hypothetical protein
VVVVVEEEAGIDGGGRDRESAVSTAVAVTGRVKSGGDLESSRDLESFGMISEMTRGGILFIGSKISAAVLV